MGGPWLGCDRDGGGEDEGEEEEEEVDCRDSSAGWTGCGMGDHGKSYSETGAPFPHTGRFGLLRR